MNRGRPEKPVPLNSQSLVVKLYGCPDCQGRGYFLINPFAVGGFDGAGGIGNKCQCQTCVSAQAYWNEHGKLPPDVVDRMTSKTLETLGIARESQR